jgi:pimeloyl-ACP methyl ester carboxylesterase
MCDADLWTDMVPDLEALGAPHFGNVYEDDSLEGMARRVLAEAPERFVLVGFSMGGFVARVLTLMAPERVTGVAFVASLVNSILVAGMATVATLRIAAILWKLQLPVFLLPDES